MSYSKRDIVDLVRVGCVEAIRALQTAHPRDPLIAFALCTDDDLAGVFHVGCTQKCESASQERGVRYLPNEWTRASDAEPQSLASVQEHLQQIWRAPPAEDWGTKRDEHFDALVEGLVAARHELGLDGSIFLTVISTDPSDHLQRLEEAALPRLNDPTVMRQWLRWRLVGTTEWLSTILQRKPPLSWADEDLIHRLREETKRLESLLEQHRHAG